MCIRDRAATSRAALGLCPPSIHSSLLRGIADQIRTVPIDGHECRTPEELAEMADEMGFANRAHRSISDALIALRKPARVLVFGSLYLAGEALSLNGSLPD